MYTYLQGQKEIYWYFEKGIKRNHKRQSLINIQGWTLNLNWTDKKSKGKRIYGCFNFN